MSRGQKDGARALSVDEGSPREWPSSQVFGLLAGVYLCRPSREAIEGWRSFLGEDAPELLRELRDVLLALDVSAGPTLDDLLWEYTRLFVGPYRLAAPPWESVYTSPKRLLMQEDHDAVLERYREAGVEVADASVLADHIGAELNFLAVLQGRAESGAAAEEALGKAERFLSEHVLRWVPAFTSDLERAAESDLYRSLARATRAAVGEGARGARPLHSRGGRGRPRSSISGPSPLSRPRLAWSRTPAAPSPPRSSRR